MSPLWTPDEITSATNGRWLVRPPAGWSPLRVSYDISGKLNGHLVVAKSPLSWKPEASDSALHTAEIVHKGAAGIVIDKSQVATVYSAPPNFPVLLVANTRQALKHLALAARQRFQGTVFAVTGTVGKTTSREMLIHVFSRQGGALGTFWNNNSVAGVHRTLASLPRDNRAGVLEMGFGLPLDGLQQSSTAAQPHVALITYLSLAHLDILDSEQLAAKPPLRILAEHKAQVFSGLVPGGSAVLRHEIPELEFLIAMAKERASQVWTFGECPTANAVLENCHLSSQRTQVRARIHGESVEYELQVPGRHMALNSLGVLLAVVAGGGDLQQACRDLKDFAPFAHRLKVLTVPWPGGAIRIIDDSFNATPASVMSSLEILALVASEFGGRRIAIFRDILRLGPLETELHAALAEHVARAQVDQLFTCGRLMKELFQAVSPSVRGHHAEDLQSLYIAVRKSLRAGDVVTIKGGMGHGGLGDLGMRKIVQGLALQADRIAPG